MSDYESDDDWKPPSEAEMKAGGIVQKLKGQIQGPICILISEIVHNPTLTASALCQSQESKLSNRLFLA